jgi:Flp pilus assembly secretin CpaC
MRFMIAPIALALTVMAAGASAEELTVTLDHSSRLPVQGAASVVVANPEVADVTVVDTNTVYVMGRSFGSTSIVVLNHAGRAVFSGDVIVVRPGSTVAVYRGVDRTDYSCANSTCAKSDHGAAGAAAAPAGH